MLPVAPVELAEFLLSASQADLQAFDLAAQRNDSSIDRAASSRDAG